MVRTKERICHSLNTAISSTASAPVSRYACELIVPQSQPMGDQVSWGCFSITTTLAPSSAALRAATMPELPPPMTSKSQSMVFAISLGTSGFSPSHDGATPPFAAMELGWPTATPDAPEAAAADSSAFVDVAAGLQPASIPRAAAERPAPAAPFKNERRDTPLHFFMIPSLGPQRRRPFACSLDRPVPQPTFRGEP